jgi:hypothetical protein
MIKFFRKIRQQLLTENKFSKYFLYAIGEIVLVVIGIFIALQLNNLNEDRKNRILEEVYYCKLLEDLNQDVVEIKNLIDINEHRIISSNKFISLIQKGKFTQKEVVKVMVGSVSKTSYTFKPSLAAFEDLKSSGNLGLLRDLKIKKELISYYTFVEGLVDVIDVNSDKTLEYFFSHDKNFAEIGWQYLPFVESQTDTTIVDVAALTPIDYPSKELKTQLMNEAIMYLGTSSRKKDLYLSLEKEVKKMQQILSEKCQSEIN